MQWFALLLLLLLWFCSSARAAPLLQAGLTFVVNSTADPGSGGCDLTECTLREAIIAANANSGLDSIHFAISGAGPHTIAPVSGLPTITSPVIIDGYTQPGASVNTLVDGDNAILMIELNGVGAGAGNNGLDIAAGGSTVLGLAINRFPGAGILLRTGSGNVVVGNFIGVDATGVMDLGNGYPGVDVFESANNVIGGSLPISRNVIAGNGGVGVAIVNGAATGNRVEGNFIGVDVSGATAVSNTFGGVLITAGIGRTDYASSNTIGGPAPGAGNLISGNAGYGVAVLGDQNKVQSNIIGLPITGTASVGNASYGVWIVDNSYTVVGGTEAGADNLITGNVIAGNGSDGVQVFRGGHNRVQGNIIGLSSMSGASVGNAGYGVMVVDASHTLVGGTAVGAGNVIAGNGRDGVRIYAKTRDAAYNQVQGNVIGANPSGSDGAGNDGNGVAISTDALGSGRAISNTVGGMDSSDGLLDNVVAARNVIWSNTGSGVSLGGPRTSRNRVSGNTIGVDSSGNNRPNEIGVLISSVTTTTATFNNLSDSDQNHASNMISGNSRSDIQIGFDAIDNRVSVDAMSVAITSDVWSDENGVLATSATTTTAAFDNLIGGDENGAGNVISGNLFDGIQISFGATGNRVVGNLIGVTADESASLGNGRHGVAIFDSPANVIGSGLPAGRNVIAGNVENGVFIDADMLGGGATNNLVLGNAIGFSDSSSADLGNGGSGVFIRNSDYNLLDGNTISGNDQGGVVITGTAAIGNLLWDNTIGLDPLHTRSISNTLDGVLIYNAPGNSVGDDLTAGNFIAGNGQNGVRISGAGSTGNRVQRNQIGGLVGDGVNGYVVMGNGQNGVRLEDGAHGNTIGGAAANAGNQIVGNQVDGVQIVFGAMGNQMQGNVIGVGFDGATAMPNTRNGILISSAMSNTIGGTAAGAGNVISANGMDGVQLSFGAAHNQIVGNRIGSSKSGDADRGNARYGVALFDAFSNTIGGAAGGARNLISGNDQHGVLIAGDISGGVSGNNQILGNYIGVNISGTAALSNTLSGILITDSSTNTIGGLAGDEGNLISGNGQNGVHIIGAAASGNRVLGNTIGANFSGALPLPNAFDGVVVQSASNNQIGDPNGGRNQISGNGRHGVLLRGPNATGNKIQDNFIGVDFSGLGDLGNRWYGVLIVESDNNLIGDTNAGGNGGNDIAFNGAGLGKGGHGVGVVTGVGNTVRRNSIHSNAGRAIDLGGDSFTINDPRDGDGGANNLQNFPVVMGVSFGPADKSIRWFLGGAASTAYTVDLYANDDADASGFGEGRNWQMAVTATTNITGFVFFTTTHPRADLFIAATATDPAGNTSEFSMVDTDGDALADAWETTGIDIDEDGSPDFDFAGLADPDHKDIFVEVDAMASFSPTQATLDMLAYGSIAGVDGFDNAPNALVHNPDGMDGIDLHIQLDERIPDQPWTGDLNGIGLDALGEDRNADGVPDPGEDLMGDGLDPGDPADQLGWPWFKRIKRAELASGGFGTSAERGNAQRLAAKRLVYRYAIFADRQATPRPRGGTSVMVSGRSEIQVPPDMPLMGGNDLMITLGAWPVNGGTPEQQAGTFMHELGHTLGLRHGGADNVQYKPNYHSIMNYTWQTPDSWMTEDANGDGVLDVRKTDIKTIGVFTDSLWSLVYSDQVFNTLNELALNEPAGIGGHPDHWTHAGSRRGVTVTVESGPVDWNVDGDSVDLSVVEPRIDDQVGALRTMTRTLESHEDWSNLVFYFLETDGFADGKHAETEPDELDLETHFLLNSYGSGPGRLQFSHEFYDASEGDLQVKLQVVRSAGTDGAVSVDYATLDGTAQAGEDYTPVTGTLTFASGEYMKTITIPIIADANAEADELISVILSNPTGVKLNAPDTVSVRIDDDDSSPVVVVNINDSGPGSLRQAILDANARPGADIIQFDIPGRGVHTIQPLSPLPNVTDQTIIDGYTQPGARPNTAYTGTNARLLIELYGASAGASPMLSLYASQSVVRGLVINRAGYTGATTWGEPAIVAVDAWGIVISGNFIGTDPTGMVGRGNHGVGVNLFRADLSIVGGYTRAERNLISDNAVGGVVISGWSNVKIHGARVLGNLIGVAADGVSPLGNHSFGNFDGLTGYGVLLAESVSGAVGSPEMEGANVIAYNAGHGVAVHDVSVHNSIRANSIYSNSYTGISLHPVGLTSEWYKTPNDPGDLDAGNNQGQNFPVLIAAVSANGVVTISGQLNSTPIDPFQLDFYASPTVDSTGFGEGKRYLGTIDVVTDEGGNVQFVANFAVGLPQGDIVTATATNRAGNTSEFSERLAVGEVLTSTLVVNSNDDVDDGTCNLAHCSLREAIHSANNHPGHDEIRFSIGSGVQTIAPVTLLPLFSDSFTIDGATQPGFAGTPIIELRGDPATDVGLWLSTHSSTVRSLVINRFQTGISVDGGGNSIQGNYIGTDVTGTLDRGNLNGIGVGNSGNLIGGTTATERNLVSGNDNVGIGVGGADNVIWGNYIGVNAAGTAAIGNGAGADDHGGINNSGVRTIIGGPAPGMGNLISGNRGAGIHLYGANWFPAEGVGTVIQGNIIGLNVAGTGLLGNRYGIHVDTAESLIGGPNPGEGNVIAGNFTGILVSGYNNVIQSNRIGTDSTGLIDRGNTGYGIWIVGKDNLIGGEGPGHGNIISGNGASGVFIYSTYPTYGSGNMIQGNLIGLAADRTTVLRNDQNGVLIGGQGSSNLVGGVEVGAVNRIVGNGQMGVQVMGGDKNRILSNIIDANGQLGIDLYPDDVTANDEGDGDDGANLLQNFPILSIASNLGGQTAIVGTLNSAPNQAYMVQFFANDTCDASGNGEGQALLGTRSVTSDGAGNAVFGAIFPVLLPDGYFVTATATDANGNTSEFSACRQASATPLADVTISKSAVATLSIGSALTYTVHVMNTGNVTATGVVFTDTSPLALQLASPIPGCSVMGSQVVCAVGNLDVGQDVTVTLVATPTAGGSITNVVAVTSASDIDTLNNTASVTTLIVNIAPVAHAGADQSVSVGQPITLNGGASFDPDGHPLTFGWVQSSGTPVALSSSNAFSPTFTAPGVAGILKFTLVVTDAFGLVSAPDTVVVTVTNSAPVASAGPNQIVGVGLLVTLNGGVSFDPDGHALTFDWAQVGGTPVTLSSSSAVSPTFSAPGSAGVISFTLTVTDSFGLVSAPDTVTIMATNRAPVADTGADQTVGVGQPVTLDGSASFDPDGHTLTFGWVQSGEASVVLSSANAVSPTFNAPGGTGVLSFTLVVTDAFGLVSAPDTVTITATNRAPFADAGSDQTVVVGRMVRLDSSGAFDPDGHAFVRGWRQIGGTPVTLSSTTAVSPTFTPMLNGVFGFALIMTDTFGLSSAPDSVVVTSTNRTPVAIVGGDQVVTPGALVTLGGSGSFDPDQHDIVYAWVQVAGDTLALSNTASPRPTFTAPDTAQTLRFELTVSDSFGLASLPQSTSVIVQAKTPSFDLYLPVIQGNR